MMNKAKRKREGWIRSIALLQCFLFFFLHLSFLFVSVTTGESSLWACSPMDPGCATVESGNARIESDGSILTVYTDNNTVINFDSLSTEAGQGIKVIQGIGNPFDLASFQLSSDSTALFRDQSGNPTVFAGWLEANGMLMMSNPNGIHFTPSAVLNVNNFLASSLNIATNNFLTGNYVFERSPGSPYAQILNEGKMTGNNIALIGSRVRNTNLVCARVGKLHLVSGDKTIVSFDSKGLINVAVETETGSKDDTPSQMIGDAAVENVGTLEGKQVIMEARVARGLFKKAVNQTGIVRATGLAEENGVIKVVANRNVQVSGDMEAVSGKIQVASEESVEIAQNLRTSGPTRITAHDDIDVKADVTTTSGDLEFLADEDLDGRGTFNQAQGTTLKTLNFGNILIQASGISMLANIISAGDLILRKGGAAVKFNQWGGSRVVTKGSIVINPGVTLNANDTVYDVGKDWINRGIFNPQLSHVRMVSDMPARVIGSNTFNDFTIIEPGKVVRFDSNETQTILGTLTLKGGYGKLLVLDSTEPLMPWKILPHGETYIVYTLIGNSVNIRGPPLQANNSDSLGNNLNWNISISWTGSGLSANWSDIHNWNTGTVPLPTSVVSFDGLVGLYPHKDSSVDAAFMGSIDTLILDGYTGTITLCRDLSLSGDLNHQTGHFAPSTFDVAFTDASKPSHIYGDNTFYNFTAMTPSKIIYFEAGKTQTILGTFKIQGAYGKHVRLISTQSGNRWLVDPRGARDITYAWVEDSNNLNPSIILMTESTNRGNSINWDPVAIWTGANSIYWNDGGNWDGLGGAAPGAGDDLVFPDVSSGSNRFSLVNDYLANTLFNSITFTASGYTLAGNDIILGQGLAGITDSAVSGNNTISLNIRVDATRDITVTNAAETLTVSGMITGAGGLNKEGLGKLVLSGANTYGGLTKVNVGVLNVQHATALGTIALGTEVVGGAALEIQGGITIGQEALTLRGYGASNTGALRNISDDNTFAGPITLQIGGAQIASDSGTLTLTGGMTGAFPLVIDGVGNVAFDMAPIAIAAGTVTKNGSGTLTYNFPNTYTGLTTINAGTLRYGVDNAILSGAITVNGGTLDIATYSDMVGTVTLGTLDLSSGTITGTTGILSGTSFVVYSGTISAIIAGDGATLAKSTPGTVVLTRANFYSGATTVTAGILKIQDSMSLGVIDGITTVSAGATLEIDGDGLSVPEYITLSGTGLYNIGALRNRTGNNTVTGLITLAAASMITADPGTTLTIDTKGLAAATYGLTVAGAGNTNFTETAPIYGTSATLTKNDTGTLTLGAFNNYTGATTINRGTLVLSGLGSIPLSTTMTINSGGMLIVDNSGSTVTDRLADTLALTMNGGSIHFIGSSSTDVFETTGALTLSSGNNTITITPGTAGWTILRFASLTRTAGASVLFRGTDFGLAPAANVSTLYFTTAPAMLGDDGAPGTPTLSIIQGAYGDGSLTGTGTDMVTYNEGNAHGLRLLNGAGFSDEYTSDLTLANANVKLTTATTAVTSTINSLILGAGASLADAGAARTITLISGNILSLGDDATIAGVTTTLAAGAVEISIRNVNNLGVSAIITTTGGLTKSGTGILTFLTAKTYTGLTSINEGTLLYGTNNAISSGAVTVNNATLDIAGFSDTVGAVILQNGTITGTSGILTGTSYSFREGTVSAILAGTGVLTRVATNAAFDSVVLLTRENTYTGATTISSGILKIGTAGNGTNTPLGTAAAGTTVASGAALDLNGYTLSTAEALTISGTGIATDGALRNSSLIPVSYNGAITLAAAARINSDFGVMTLNSNIAGAFLLTVGGFSDMTLNGVLSTITGVTKDGIGTVTLSGDNSYAGTTTISMGTIRLGAAGGSTNTPLGTAAGITTITAGARLDLNGFTLGTAEPLTLRGTGFGTGDFASGALINSSSTSVTYSGLITLGAASTIKADYGDIHLTHTGTTTGATFGLTLGGWGNGSLACILGTTTGTMTKIGLGTWTLSGASTFTGATTIAQGTLRLGGAGSGLNTPLGVIAAGTTVVSGAALDLNGYTLATAESLALNGRGINDGGALVNNSGSATGYSGARVLGSDTRITNSGAGLLTLSGGQTGAFELRVGGAGNTTISAAMTTTTNASVTKEGAGTLLLSAANAYTGLTTVKAGTLQYGIINALSSGGVTVNGGMLDIASYTDTVGAIILTGGTITGTTGNIIGTSYTVENGTISAILGTSAATLTKNTNGTVTMTAANTYTGATTINAGTIVLSGLGSVVGSAFTINLGATLTLDNANANVANRLGDALAVTLNGGHFNFIGTNVAATNASETAGALTLSTGFNIVTITPGTGGSTTMTFANMTRTAGAGVLFRGTSLGSGPAENVSTLMFTTAPTLTGAAGPANSTTVSIIKGAFGDHSLTGTGTDMVTYNVGNAYGLRLLNGAGYTNEYAGDFSTTSANVKLTANTVAVTRSINSLILNGYGVTNPGAAVTLTLAGSALSGNVLINSANNMDGANTTLGITTYELCVLASADSVISAKIGTATSGALNLSGTGNVTLTAANLYTGTTYINNATLTYGVANALSSGGVTIVGGTYNLNAYSDTIGALSMNAGTVTTGSGSLTLGGTVTTIANNYKSSMISGNLDLGANRIFNVGNGLVEDDLIVSAVISGAFTVTKSTGTGILVFSGDNTYTGLTMISAGILKLGAAGGATNTPLGTTAAGTVVSGSSSALDLNGFTLGTAEALTLSGALATGALQNTSGIGVSYSGLITLGAASTIISNYGDIHITHPGNITGAFALTIGGAGNGSLASNLNTGTGTLTKNGLGTWTVSGLSSYTGLTTISTGVLRLGAAGDATHTPLGTTSAGTTVASGAVLDLNGFTLGTTETLTIAGTGIANRGAISNNSANATEIRGAIIRSAASRIVNYGAGTLTLSGNISGNFALTTVAAGDITQANTSVISGTASLIKEGSGVLTLAGQNSMTGAITVSTGILRLGANGGATNTPLGTSAGGVTISSGAVLDLSTYTLGGASTYEPLAPSGSGIRLGGAVISNAATGNTNFGAVTPGATVRITNNGAGTLTLTGAVTLTSSRHLVVQGSGNININGVIGTAVAATLTKYDAGTLTLGANNTFTGLTRINGGALKYAAAGRLVGPVTVAGGTLNMNGVTDTVGAVTLISGSIINTGAAATLTGTSYTVESGTISAVLGGAVALNKNTAGIVTLSAANTYTGLTTINAGTLAWGINNALSSGGVTVTGGILDLGAYTDTVGTVILARGSIVGVGTLTSTATYDVRSGTISAILAGAVALTKTTAGTVKLLGANTYSGITTLTAGTLSVSSINNGGVAGNLGQASSAAANLVLNAGTLQYTGATASTDRNFTLTAAVTTIFDITNPSTVFTISGASTNTTGLVTKAGSGILVLSGTNLHTGTTTVLAGTLRYGITNALSTGAVTVNNGTLDIAGFSDTVGAVTLQNAGSIIDSVGTTAILTSTATFAFQSGTVSARLGSAVAAGISKTTSGRVILSGDNPFTSTSIALSAGALNLRNNNALGSPAVGLRTTITSGAALELENNITLPATKVITANGTGVNGQGAIRNISGSNTIQGTVTLGATNMRVNSDNGSLALSGNIGGATFNLLVGGAGNTTISGIIGTTSGTLTKNGVGTLTLSGNNTYTGLTTISGGVVKLGASGTSPNGPLGTTAAGTVVATGGALDLNGFTLATAEGLTLNGTGMMGGGALTNTSAIAATYSGLITLGSTGVSIIASNGDINLTATGTITGATFSLTLGGSGNGSLASIIGTTSGTVTKAGIGTWTVSGSSTYTGLTTISEGVLKLGAAGGATNTPLGTAGSGTVVSAAGAALDLNGFTLGTAEALTLNGTGISAGGALTNTSASTVTYSGLITLGSDASIVVSNGNINITNAGTITGTGYALTLGGTGNGSLTSNIGTSVGGSLIKTGTGLWTIWGVSSNYTGTTVISMGTLKLGAAGVIPNASAMIVDGTLDMNAKSETIGSLAGNGSITSSAPGAITLTAGGDNSSTAFSGTIDNGSGTVSFTKAGSGTLTLSNTVTLGGNLAISAGTLAISGSPTLTVYGNWSNSGIFVAGTSTVVFRGTSQSDITGTNSFYNLTINTAADGAKTVRFGAGQTQTVTNTLVLTGAAGKVLTINSTDGATPAILTIPVSITTGIDYVNVSHNHITGPNIILAGSDSTLVIDFTGWYLGGIILTVTVTADNKIYDGINTASVTLFDDRIPGDVFAVNYATALFSDRNVANGKTVTVSGLSISGPDAFKYTLASTTVTTTANITARAITVTAGTDTKIYDGNSTSIGTPTVTAGTLVGGDTITAITQTFDNRNVGIGKTLTASGVVTDGNSGNNYSVTFATNATGEITARAITVTAGTDTKIYDGNTTSAGVPTVTNGSLVGGDTINTMTQTFDNRNVGIGKTLTASGVVTDGNSGNNYSVTFVTNATGEITARAITVTAGTDTKIYDGNATSTGTPTVTVGSLVGGDTINAITQTFDNRNVGIGKTLTASGVVTDGNSGNNYNVTFVTNATGEITARAIEFTALTDTKIFDGTTASSKIPLITSGSLQGTDTRELVIQTFNNADVGTNKTLTVSGRVSDGNGGNNYTYTYMPIHTGVINPASPPPVPDPDQSNISEQDLNLLTLNPFSAQSSGIGMGAQLAPVGGGEIVLVSTPAIAPGGIVLTPGSATPAKAEPAKRMTRASFFGAVGKEMLGKEANSLNFEAPSSATAIKLLFPGGANIVTTRGLSRTLNVAGRSDISSMFTQVFSNARLPENPFLGVRASERTPETVAPDFFMNASAGARMPQFITEKSFADAYGSAVRPGPAPEFKGIVSKSISIGDRGPLNFEMPAETGGIKLTFPGGVKIIPTYGLGMPLGADKPLLEAKIRKGEREK